MTMLTRRFATRHLPSIQSRRISSISPAAAALVSAKDSLVTIASSSEAAERATLYSQLKAEGFLRLYTPSGLLENAIFALSDIAHLPWGVSISAVGISLPLLLQFGFKAYSRQYQSHKALLENQDLIKDYECITQTFSKHGQKAAHMTIERDGRRLNPQQVQKEHELVQVQCRFPMSPAIFDMAMFVYGSYMSGMLISRVLQLTPPGTAADQSLQLLTAQVPLIAVIVPLAYSTLQFRRTAQLFSALKSPTMELTLKTIATLPAALCLMSTTGINAASLLFMTSWCSSRFLVNRFVHSRPDVPKEFPKEKYYGGLYRTPRSSDLWKEAGRILTDSKTVAKQ